MARIQGFHSKLDIPPGASAEVPVSWFVYSRTQWPSVRLQAMGPGFAESRNFPQRLWKSLKCTVRELSRSPYAIYIKISICQAILCPHISLIYRLICNHMVSEAGRPA